MARPRFSAGAPCSSMRMNTVPLSIWLMALVTKARTPISSRSPKVRAFVNNAVDELYHSPLRSDPRPLDGIFHATYVSARTHYAHRKLLESGVLSAAEEDAVEQALIASQAAFRDGLRTLEEHASLTGLGQNRNEWRP